MTLVKKLRWPILAAIPVLFIGAFFYWPLIKIFSHALGSEGIGDFKSLVLVVRFTRSLGLLHGKPSYQLY